MELPLEVLEKTYQQKPDITKVNLMSLSEEQITQLYRYYVDRLRKDDKHENLNVLKKDVFGNMKIMHDGFCTTYSESFSNDLKKCDKYKAGFADVLKKYYANVKGYMHKSWGAVDYEERSFSWKHIGGLFASSIVNDTFGKKITIGYDSRLKVDGFLAFLEDKNVTVKKFGPKIEDVQDEDKMLKDKKGNQLEDDWGHGYSHDESDILSCIKNGNVHLDCEISDAYIGHSAKGGEVNLYGEMANCDVGMFNDGANFYTHNYIRNSRIGKEMKSGKIIIGATIPREELIVREKRSRNGDFKSVLTSRDSQIASGFSLVHAFNTKPMTECGIGSYMEGGMIIVENKVLRDCEIAHGATGGSVILTKRTFFDKKTLKRIGGKADGACIHILTHEDAKLSWIDKLRLKLSTRKSGANIFYHGKLLHEGSEDCECDLKGLDDLK